MPSLNASLSLFWCACVCIAERDVTQLLAFMVWLNYYLKWNRE